jgi:hypothetical protein
MRNLTKWTGIFGGFGVGHAAVRILRKRLNIAQTQGFFLGLGGRGRVWALGADIAVQACQANTYTLNGGAPT